MQPTSLNRAAKALILDTWLHEANQGFAQNHHLKTQDVRVIAISADKTEQGFQKKLAYHQRPDNYCDFTGMAGKNFTNYGVLGVPTLFLLDQEGMVVKKTAMVDELITFIYKVNPVDPS